MWQKTPDLVNQSTFTEAVINAYNLNLASHTDWRLPSVKELYSLIDFRGHIGTTVETSTPYIDTNYFDFVYGDVNAGERIIDAQYWSSTPYVGTTMNNDATFFGVNFADGRIKGYPFMSPRGEPTHFVRYVRGNTDYGKNNFVDNGDGTVTDLATNLMWQQTDSGVGYNWRQALSIWLVTMTGDYPTPRNSRASSTTSVRPTPCTPSRSGLPSILSSRSPISARLRILTIPTSGAGRPIWTALTTGVSM
jgi:hypothetical protein